MAQLRKDGLPKQSGGPRHGGGRPFSPTSKRRTVQVRDLQLLIANMQALVNIAEVKALHLLEDQEWQVLKAHLFVQAKALGVDALVDRLGKEQLKRLEERDDEDL